MECNRVGSAWSDIVAASGRSAVRGTSGIDGGMWTKSREAQERTSTKELPSTGGERVGAAVRGRFVVDVDGVGYHCEGVVSAVDTKEIKKVQPTFFCSPSQRILTTCFPSEIV